MECVLFLNRNTFISGTDQTLTAVNGAICGCILIFNLLAIWGILRTKLKKKPLTATKKLLLILFGCCILVGLVLLPYQIYMVQRGENCSNVIGHTFTANFLTLVLIHLIVLMVMERHVLIVHRKKHRKDYSGRQLRLYVAIAVIVAAVWSIVQALLNNQSKKQSRLAVFFIVQVTYVIVLLLFVVANTLKISKMVSIVSRQTSSLNLHNKRTERRLSKTVILIAVIFVLCLIPLIVAMIYFAHHLLDNDLDTDKTSSRLLLSRQVLVWCTIPLFVSCFLASVVFVALDRKIRTLCSRDSSLNISSQHPRKLSQQSRVQYKQQQKINLSFSGDNIENNNNRTKLADIGRRNSIGGLKLSDTPGRKISKESSFKDMQKKVSVVSATMEIRNGALVLKQEEKRIRKISRQATVNQCYEENE